jgi:hypothetical protein
MTNLSIFDFESNNIRFEKRDNRIWVNLTDMAKASGKKIGHWNELKSTQEFLETLSECYEKKLQEEASQLTISEYCKAFQLFAIIENSKKARNPKYGEIYVITDNYNRYKIGYSEELKQRIESLQVGNASELKIVKTFKGNLISEKTFHKLFSKYRIRGEWYTKEILTVLSQELIDSLSFKQIVSYPLIYESNKTNCLKSELDTWVIEDVAIKFATWCSFEFELWIKSQIKTLLPQGTIPLPQQFNLPSEVVALETAKAVAEIQGLLGDSNPCLAQFLINYAVSDLTPTPNNLIEW